ncbi:MAG: hypothetical protein FWC41_03890 [Firmicutes bacterium]|nr:hypothetical protein [Bacillota bacterium]
MVNDIFKDMENKALRLILRDHPPLLNQLKNAVIAKREFTGVGFFTDFLIDNNVFCGKNMQISDVGAKINNSVEIGFVLFIEKGKLDFLEGYTYDAPWPDTIKTYKLYVISTQKM